MAKLPHEIDCRIDLTRGAYAIIVDGERFNQPELPKGLEGVVNHLQFVRSFSQGAQEAIIERGDKSNLVYRLESDQIRDNQRWFLYRRV